MSRDSNPAALVDGDEAGFRDRDKARLVERLRSYVAPEHDPHRTLIKVVIHRADHLFIDLTVQVKLYRKRRRRLVHLSVFSRSFDVAYVHLD